jgi:hypothetical protein
MRFGLRRFVLATDQADSMSQNKATGNGGESGEAMREKLALHEKERRAITTIMEHKIKTLVDGIAAATSLGIGCFTPLLCALHTYPYVCMQRLRLDYHVKCKLYSDS